MQAKNMMASTEDLNKAVEQMKNRDHNEMSELHKMYEVQQHFYEEDIRKLKEDKPTVQSKVKSKRNKTEKVVGLTKYYSVHKFESADSPTPKKDHPQKLRSEEGHHIMIELLVKALMGVISNEHSPRLILHGIISEGTSLQGQANDMRTRRENVAALLHLFMAYNSSK